MSTTEEEIFKENIVLEYTLDAPPEKVWRALTVPELAASWLGTQEHRPEHRPEHRNDDPAYELLDKTPFSRVRYAWRDTGTDMPETLVTFEISPAPDGNTRFRLTHSVRATPPLAANCNGAPIARAA